jgi:hypothetical protein
MKKPYLPAGRQDVSLIEPVSDPKNEVDRNINYIFKV